MFTKDSRVENFLTHMGVSWRYCDDLAYADLAVNWDYVNHGRNRARLEDAILEYAMRMETGSAAPGVIVQGLIPPRPVLDGVQRLCAGAFRNYTRFAGYIVDTDSNLTATKIRVLANHLLAGHPEPSEWTRSKAVELLVIAGGMSIDEVASLGGWPRDAVERDKIYLDWSPALVHIGAPDTLSKGTVLAIAQHAKLDDLRVAPQPIAKFCQDMKKAKLLNGESEPFIKSFFDVNRKDRKNLHQKFKHNLEDFQAKEEISVRLEGRPTGRRTPDIKLRQVMRAVLSVVEELSANGEVIQYMDEYHQLWNQVNGKLKQLAGRRKAATV